MKPPIAILFANLKGNIGDFAILHAMLVYLQRRFPGQSLHVFSHGFYGVDERRLAAFRASSQIQFELAGTTYFRVAESKLLERVVRPFGLWPVAQAHLIGSLAERVASCATKFREYEAIFIAGGEHWSGTSGGISMFGTLSAVHRHNERIYTFPFSISPRIRSFNSKQALQRYFQKIREPLIVRDGISKTVLDELGISSVLGADSVYTMQDFADKIEPTEGRDRSRILFALTGSRKKFEVDLRAALRQVGGSVGPIALMTTCELEDGARSEAIAREFGIAYYAPTTWQEAVAEIKASSLLVTNRLHGLILGSLANTPLLPVANRKKAEAFVRDAQIRHSSTGTHTLTSGLIERCLADSDAILKSVKHYQARIRTTAKAPILESPVKNLQPQNFQ